MRLLLLPLVSLFLLPASAPASAELLVGDCPALTAVVNNLNTSALGVTASPSLPPVVTLTASPSAADAVTVSGSVVVDGLRYSSATTAWPSLAAPHALRCAEGEGEGVVRRVARSNALCVCLGGLLRNAGSPRLPCLVHGEEEEDVGDHLALGLAVESVHAWPRGGLAALSLDQVPTYTETIGRECNAAIGGGGPGWMRVGDLCTYMADEEVPFAQARWECLAAGGFLLSPNDWLHAWAIETRDPAKNTLLSTGKKPWVGLLDPRSGGEGNRMTALNGGLPGSHYAFLTGEPSSRHLRCTTTGSNQLASADCALPQAVPLCGFAKVEATIAERANRVLLMSNVADVYESSDGGMTITAKTTDTTLSGNSEDSYPAEAAMVGDVVLAVNRNNVYISNDGGATWKPTGLGSDHAIRSPSIDARNPNVMALAKLENGKVFFTVDGGAIWREVSVPNAGTRQAVSTLIFDDKILIGNDNSHIIRFTRYAADDTFGQETEETTTTVYPVGDVNTRALCMKDDASVILAAGHTSSRSYAARSTDAGDSWTPLASDPAAAADFDQIFPTGGASYTQGCSFQGSTDRVVVYGSAVLYSDDAGTTWTEATLPAGYENGGSGIFRSATIQPDGSGIGCGYNFVLLTEDGGASWDVPAGVSWPAELDFSSKMRFCAMW